MTEYDDDLDTDNENEDIPEQQPDRNPLRAQVRKLETELREARKDADAGKAAVRETAFLKAGINPDDPKARYFLKGYDGELTAEAITAEAVAAGLVEAPAAEAEQVPADEKAAWGRAQQVSAGGDPVGGHGIDDQIREATQAGDHLRAIALKRERAGLHK